VGGLDSFTQASLNVSYMSASGCGLTYGTGRVTHDGCLVLLTILEYLRIHWLCVKIIDTSIVLQIFLTCRLCFEKDDVLLRYREVLAGA
jgi:hypothetical protein